jgi:hypothetical protein
MNGNVERRGETWAYRFDLSPDPLTGKRRQTGKRGFATRKEAETAMRVAIRARDRAICTPIPPHG